MKSTQQNTFWKPVLFLLLLEFFVVLSWIAYHKFQPILLAGFGLAEYTKPFLFVQVMVLTLTPMWAGHMTDKLKKAEGKGLFMIQIGIFVAALLFLAVASSVVIGPNSILFFVLPLLIVLWLVSMNTFHSPAVGFLDQMVSPTTMPMVFALLATITDVSQATEPIIVEGILYLGGPITFLIGGICIFFSGVLFIRYIPAPVNVIETSDTVLSIKTPWSLWFKILGMGLLMGIFTGIYFGLMPGIIEKGPFQNYNSFSGNSTVSLMLLCSGLLNILFGKISSETFNTWVTLALVGMGCAIPILLMSTNLWLWGIACIGFIIFFSICSVLFLPIAFREIPKEAHAFGVGVFFGGLELANGIFDFL